MHEGEEFLRSRRHDGTVLLDPSERAFGAVEEFLALGRVVLNDDPRDTGEDGGRLGNVSGDDVPVAILVDHGAVAQTSDELRQLEDYAACCCAIHNLSLYLWQAGVGMKWSTGPVTRDERLYELLGIRPDEEIVVGLVSYGYPRKIPRQKRKPVRDIFRVVE